MMTRSEGLKLIEEAISQFPAEFGLLAFPGERFRISKSYSYVNDSDELMLVTEIFKDSRWLSFAKGPVSELKMYVVELM